MSDALNVIKAFDTEGNRADAHVRKLERRKALLTWVRSYLPSRMEHGVMWGRLALSWGHKPLWGLKTAKVLERRLLTVRCRTVMFTMI
jgi:hypothetical protein